MPRRKKSLLGVLLTPSKPRGSFGYSIAKQGHGGKKLRPTAPFYESSWGGGPLKKKRR